MARGAGPRMTLPTQLVLWAMLAEPTQEMYGLQIGQAAELPSGTTHPILARLEGCAWLESRWGDIDPVKEGRPRRRYYRLSADGVKHARNALAQVHTPRALVNRLSPGTQGEPLGAPTDLALTLGSGWGMRCEHWPRRGSWVGVVPLAAGRRKESPRGSQATLCSPGP